MRKVEAYVSVPVLDRVKEALSHAGVDGLTISEVTEHDRRHQHVEHYRGGSVAMDSAPILKIEIVLEDFKTSQIVEAIRKAARTGRDDDGLVCAFPVDDVVRIRTGEHGRDAI